MGQLKQALISCSPHSQWDYDTLEPDVGYMPEDALAEFYDEKLENRCEAQWQANNLMRSVEG